MNKKIIKILSVICLTCFISHFTLAAAASNSGGLIASGQQLYSDIRESDWFYTYVKDLSQKNVVNGFPNGTFQPNNTVSCGEALKLILLAAGYDKQDAADGNWAGGYLKLAISKGLIQAKDITNLNEPISRLLIAQISAKALGLSKSDTGSPFSDTSDGYVISLYQNGIVKGNTEQENLVFRPSANICRSEISAVIWRICNTKTDPVDPPDNSPKTIQFGNHTLDVLKNVPVNSYDADNFYTADSVMHYRSDTVRTSIGIDVSSFQGNIDWEKVKASGVQYVIIRLGFRGYGSSGSMNLDSYFEKNIRGALDAGLQVGVYFFSQAITAEEAAEEANYVLSHIQGYDITCPVVFDWENISSASARTDGLDSGTLCQCANTFCSIIKNAGYQPMIYFNCYIGYLKYDLSKIQDYDFWLAQYSSAPTFYYNFNMWQYTSKGSVDGISGNVDMDICFTTP